MKLPNNHHPARHIKSFHYAFRGLWHALLNEPNFRVQMVIVVVMVIMGFRYSVSLLEWGLLTISLGLLLVAEMINTVVENFIDVLIKDYHNGAKIIKDISAGFVLVTAIINLIIFFLIFGKFFI